MSVATHYPFRLLVIILRSSLLVKKIIKELSIKKIITKLAKYPEINATYLIRTVHIIMLAASISSV